MSLSETAVVRELPASEAAAVIASPSSSTPRRNAAPYLAVAALICFFYCPLFLPGNGVFGFDYYNFNVPNREYASKVLRSGSLPLWAPEVFGGYPFLADPQTGVFGPLNLLVAAAIPNPGDSYFFQLYTVFHVVLVGMAGVFLSRSIATSRAGAVVTGLVCALNGYNMWHFTHVNFFPAMAGALFAVGCMIRAVHQRDLKWSCLSGLAIAFSLLSSHPQISIHLAYVTVIAAAFLWLRHARRGEMRRLTVLCALPLLIGVAGGLAQILPSLDFFAVSGRADMSFETASQSEIAPDQLPSLIFPRFYRPFWWRIRDVSTPSVSLDHWSRTLNLATVCYVGLIAFVLAVLAVASHRRSRGVWMLVVAFAVCWLLALGKSTSMYRLAFEYVPWFRTGRMPSRLCWMGNCALGVLAGIGVDAAVAASRDVRRRRPVWIAAAICLLLLFAGAAVLLVTRERSGSWTITFLNLFARRGAQAQSHPGISAFIASIALQFYCAAAIIALLITWAVAGVIGRRPRFTAAGAVLLVFAELSLYGFHENIATHQPHLRNAKGEWPQLVAIPPNGRAVCAESGDFAKNAALPAGSELAGGYNPLVFQHATALLPPEQVVYNPWVNALRDIWNVKYAIFPRRDFTTPTPGMEFTDLGYLEMGTSVSAIRFAAWDVTTTTHVNTVALVSGSGYTYAHPDNFQIGYIELTGRDSSCTTAPIRLGRETAEWAYDSAGFPFPPAHHRPEIAVPILSQPNRFFFLSRFDVPETMTLSRVAVHVTARDILFYVSELCTETKNGWDAHPALEALGYSTFENGSARHVSLARENNPGYAWMVGQAEPVSYRGNYSWVTKRLSQGFDVRRRVLLDEREFTSAALEQLNASAGVEFAGTAGFERIKPDSVKVQTHANARGWLVVSQAFFSKWRAFVDGKPARLAQADGAICAVPVPAGNHTVELRLVWPEVWVGIGVSMAAWLGAIGMLVVPRKR